MNDKATNTSTKPRHDVFVVDDWKDAEGTDRSTWMRVGVAFPHKDSKGFNMELKAIPVSGKLVIREHEPKAKE
jgi:hypothetical protein